MRYGVAAFTLTGTPTGHGPAMQTVANRFNHAILLRAVGSHCTRLLEEGYAAKGFRIDTKSCDWGPMRGFVCVDPRLSKGGRSKEAANRAFTAEALRGEIRHDAVGGSEGADMRLWAAGCKPIVISAARLRELREGGHINVTGALPSGILRGTDTDGAGQIRFPWRLIPARACLRVEAFRVSCPNAPADGFGVFADKVPNIPFTLEYPGGAAAIRVDGYEAVLGLSNPGTETLGYRACVTGDYDLFAVWPPREERLGAAGPALTPTDIIRSAAALGTGRRVRAVGEDNWSDRYVDDFAGQAHPHHHQHYQLGNITRRINLIKTQLNTLLQTEGGYTGGALVHHSDEVGNPSPGLVKTLDESMPMIAFLPRHVQPYGIENVIDFRDFVHAAQDAGLLPELRPEWRHFLRA